MKKVIKVSILVITIIILLFVFLLLFKYYRWEKDFKRDIDTRYLVSTPYSRSEELSKKIDLFTLSEQDNEYLELTPYELGGLILETADRYPIDQMYIYPQQGIWKIYLKVRYMNIPLWLRVDINKDNMQTAQIYITKVYVGPYSIGQMFSITANMNSGITDALLTVNENGFSGRYLENIELLNDKVVVKGSKY